MQRNKGTVLVVDDEPLLRRVYRRRLEPAGYAVVEASSVREALQRLADHGEAIRLVITDWHLAVGTAAGLLEHVGAHWPALPVVCVTGAPDEPASARPMQVLRKPCGGAALLDAVDAHLARVG